MGTKDESRAKSASPNEGPAQPVAMSFAALVECLPGLQALASLALRRHDSAAYDAIERVVCYAAIAERHRRDALRYWAALVDVLPGLQTPDEGLPSLITAWQAESDQHPSLPGKEDHDREHRAR
jgi:hypothetical protein